MAALDDGNPHGGTRCLRIYHPAGGQGVARPDYSRVFPIKRDHAYEISLWLRTDVPGMVMLQLYAFESCDPLKGARRGPDLFPLYVTDEWRQFRFELAEGRDLRLERHRCAYVMVFAWCWGLVGVERNLWVDDVSVTERALAQPLDLVNEYTMPASPPAHRLEPGDVLNITADLQGYLSAVPLDTLGIGFYRVATHGWIGDVPGMPYDPEGNYTIPPALEEGIRSLHTPMTRFCWLSDKTEGVERPLQLFGLNEALDKVAAAVDRLGIPQDRTVLNLEPPGTAGWRLTPEQWAEAVQYCLGKGYGFRYWEVDNEPWSCEWSYWGYGRGPYDSFSEYATHVREVAQAVRAVQPEAQIGIHIHYQKPRWCNYLLHEAAGAYDFVVGHWYSHLNAYTNPFEEVVLSENYRLVSQIERVNELMAAYATGLPPYQYDTEWGQYSPPDRVDPEHSWRKFTLRRGNIYGCVFDAVRLIFYLREAPLEGACHSPMIMREMINPDMGIFVSDAPEARGMLYWLFRLFREHVRSTSVEIRGTAPWYEDKGPLTPAVVMCNDDLTEMTAVVANGSWEREVPCTLHTPGFEPVEAEAVLFSHDDPDANPMMLAQPPVAEWPVILDAESVRCTIPAHSVLFMRLEAG